MAEIIRMPQLSDTMTEGVVAAWHKKIGDKVKAGDVLADIETDKATMEFESFQEGVLLYIGVSAGKTAAVNSILAIVGKEGEDYKALLNPKNTAPSKTVADIEKNSVLEPTEIAEKTTPNATPIYEERIKISPLAKKIAQEKGVDIHDITGTGDQGRIIRRDIEAVNIPVKQKENHYASDLAFIDEVNSSMRKTIARRLSESKQTAPHYYLMLELDMDKTIADRKAINEVSAIKISFNDLVIKAAAMALTQHPKVNSSWLGDATRMHQHINIGVAVAVEDGLLVPVIRNADQKKLSLISSEVKFFASKAKEKKLQPKDWENSTFTISNLGMMGIEEFTSIINQPDSAILSVGAIIEKPVVKNGQIVIGNRMKITLACDHRTVDGATGAAFLQTFKNYIENPILMMV